MYRLRYGRFSIPVYCPSHIYFAAASPAVLRLTLSSTQVHQGRAVAPSTRDVAPPAAAMGACIGRDGAGTPSSEHAVVLFGDSNFHFRENATWWPMSFVMPRGASTAELVSEKLQQRGVTVYAVGCDRIAGNSHYDIMTSMTTLRAVKSGGKLVSMAVAIGQNDCFGTRTTQRDFRKSIAERTQNLALAVDSYVEKVVVMEPFDELRSDGLSYFGVEYDERVDILRSAWHLLVRRETKWTRTEFAPSGNDWVLDHMHLKVEARSSLADVIIEGLGV